MKTVMLLIAVAAVLCPALYAENCGGVKIDFDARGAKIKLNDAAVSSGLKAMHPVWAKEQRDFYLVNESTASLSGNEWKEFEISFVPETSGTVVLALRGNFTKPGNTQWMQYDNFKVTGATLVNPSFETVQNGMPRPWSRVKKLFVGRDDAPDGKNYVAASHNDSVFQSMTVKAGEPVVIRFMARPGKLETK